MPDRDDRGQAPGETAPDNTVAAKVFAAFLHSGRILDHASSVLALGALLTAGRELSPLAAALLATTLGFAMLEKYYAWRVALDADLFRVLAEHPSDLAQFDAALQSVIGGVPAPARSIMNRWAGARRLLYGQVLALLLQTLGLLLLVGVWVLK